MYCIVSTIVVAFEINFYLSICLSIYYQTCGHNYYENKRNEFDANWHKWCTAQRHEMINFGSQKVKDQGHTKKPNIDLKATAQESVLTP